MSSHFTALFADTLVVGGNLFLLAINLSLLWLGY